MLPCCACHSVALVLGTILHIMDCLYLRLPGGNDPLSVLKESQSEQWHILSPMTLDGCACSTARFISCHVGRWHSWDNLTITQFALRCMWSEREKWFAIQTQLLALLTLLSTSTNSRLKSSHSWSALWLRQKMVWLFCVLVNETSWTKKLQEFKNIYPFFPPTPSFS